MNTASSSSPAVLGYARRQIIGDLERIGKLGAFLSALGRMQYVLAREITEATPCGNCSDLHAELCNGFAGEAISGGIEEVGIYIADIALRAEETIYEFVGVTGDDPRGVDGIVANQGEVFPILGDRGGMVQDIADCKGHGQ